MADRPVLDHAIYPVVRQHDTNQPYAGREGAIKTTCKTVAPFSMDEIFLLIIDSPGSYWPVT